MAADLASGLSVWDLTKGTLSWGGINTMAITFVPDSNILAYSDISENNDIVLVSPDGRQKLKTFSGDQGLIWDLQFSPDGRLLMSHGIATRIWRVEDGQLLFVGKSECP
jgi:WD40 repeat protein